MESLFTISTCERQDGQRLKVTLSVQSESQIIIYLFFFFCILCVIMK